MNTDNDISYFIFSSSELKRLIEVDSKMGRKYNPKFVIINGARKEYTSIVKSMNNLLYTDAIKVASGDLSKMKYTR